MHDQFDYWTIASCALAATDPIMANIISRCGEGRLRSRGDAFETLARAIVGQQISVKAADSVWQRVLTQTAVTPQALLSQTVEQLRSCGLSYRKSEYLHDLANHFFDGRIEVARFAEMSDAEIIQNLIRVKGIGQWSAEMFLMFHLLRPNVFPLKDIGLQKAMWQHYPHLSGQGLTALAQYAQLWHPWRSVATWYLWRSLDPHEVSY